MTAAIKFISEESVMNDLKSRNMPSRIQLIIYGTKHSLAEIIRIEDEFNEFSRENKSKDKYAPRIA